jgi:hypothetical protein
MSSSTAPSVSLRFSLVDNPRTQIEEWFEDVMAEARRLCIQWDITGAITLVASDSVWNAVPGNITNPAQVLAGSHPPAYRPRPDYDPPVALDPAATAVELANWKLEMDMHFAYTLALNSLSSALLASVGPVNTTLLKVAYTPTPLHFLTPRQIIDCMFTKHASLTGPDLKKLRAPLFEPLQAVAELEAHMGKFVLASIKLSATGHGEDSYRYFELFLESIKGFPLISTTLDGFYQRYPTVPQQNITSLFGYLEPMVSHLIEQTGSAPFSGGAITPKAPTPNPNRRKKVKGKQKGQWGSWANEGAAAHLAGGVFQAQTPPTFLDTDREAGYMAEIERLQARLIISDAQNAFSMQHVYAAQQNGSSASRPRSHYCGMHGWNNDHNGIECRGMARDKRYTPAMRAATTHVGTGGNPKVGVPVSFVRPSLFNVSSWPTEICLPLPSETCLTCLSPPCLPLSYSPASNAKAKPAPYEDRRAPASPAVPLPQSEGNNAALVRESAADLSVSLSLLPVSPSLRSSVSWSLPLATVFVFSSSSPVVPTDQARQAEIIRQDRTRPTQTRPHKASPDKSQPAVSSRLSVSRFACPSRYDDLASSSEDEDEPSSPVCSPLSMPANPFSALRVPPPPCLGISCLVRP